MWLIGVCALIKMNKVLGLVGGRAVGEVTLLKNNEQTCGLKNRVHMGSRVQFMMIIYNPYQI